VASGVAVSADQALTLAGLVFLIVATLWLLGRLLGELGWDNVRRQLRDPPYLLLLLGLLLIVASYLA
jgi:hypothetical protein